MLALPVPMSANEFPYDALLQRPISHSKKSLREDSEQIEPLRMNLSINNASMNSNIEWKPEHFPHKMYDLLEDVERKGLDEIVSWLPDGKSFKIHSQIGFEQSIMPMYFSGMSSYKSFRRQLNLYGIYQHRHRPNQDANGKLTITKTEVYTKIYPRKPILTHVRLRNSKLQPIRTNFLSEVNVTSVTR